MSCKPDPRHHFHRTHPPRHARRRHLHRTHPPRHARRANEGKGKKLIELSCTHVMCTSCAEKMAGVGMERCPICRHAHLLDPKLLAARSAQWRSEYGGWRQGKVRGAVGEVSSINTLSAAQRHAREDVAGDGASCLVRALDLASPEPRTSKSQKLRLQKAHPVSSAGGSLSQRSARPIGGTTTRNRFQRDAVWGATREGSANDQGSSSMHGWKDLEA